MKITKAMSVALVRHINDLSRESQVDSLRAVLRSFSASPEKEVVNGALRKRMRDISDDRESRSAMP